MSLLPGFAKIKDMIRIQVLEQEIKEHPENHRALLELAILYFDPCYLDDQAIALFKQLIIQDPQNVDAYFWYAECIYSLIADYAEAEKILRKALSINSNRADCLMLLASIISSERSDDQEIIPLFTQAIQLEPTWLSSRRFLAGYLIEKSKLFEAKQLIVESLPYIPEFIPSTEDSIVQHYEILVTGRWCNDNKEIFLDLLHKIDVLLSNKI